MTPQQKYDFVRSKIIEAVPELNLIKGIREFCDEKGNDIRINFEDVLMVLKKLTNKLTDNCPAYKKQEWDFKHFMAHNVLELLDKWSLGKPLSEQSPELWEWLYEILK